MKFFTFILCLIPAALIAQNENTLTVKVNGTEFQTQPRQVNMGSYAYFTANDPKPETMLRIWLGDFKGTAITESGTYLVIDAENPPSDKEIKAEEFYEKFKGYAAVRYVTETKSPRMSYHVGDSGNNGETIEVKNSGDGYIEIIFDLNLNGTHWKERKSATVVGGLGRLQNKMESKIISKSTGYDWNIDPEGNGYRKLNETDTIKLTEGSMKIKIN